MNQAGEGQRLFAGRDRGFVRMLQFGNEVEQADDCAVG